MPGILRLTTFVLLGCSIGLSGFPGKDEECVAAGMDKIASQLK